MKRSSYINDLLEESDTEDEVEEESVIESAYSTSSYSESSVDSKSARHALKEKEKKARKLAEQMKKSKKKKAKEEQSKTVNLHCKHCTKHRRRGSHPAIPEKKYRFNLKAKVLRQKWISDLLGLEYKGRDIFSEEDTGYPPLEEADASSGSGSD